VGLIGSCEDCGATGVPLQYKPGKPVNEQSRPSVCDRCRDRRKEQATIWVRCEDCGDRLPSDRATSLDVTPDDEYYPEFIHFCPGCAPSDDTEQPEGAA